MKIFNSAKELWDYCKICPLCKKERKILITMGPDYEVIKVEQYVADSNNLILKYLYKNIKYQFIVNLVNNTISYENIPFRKINDTYFFYIEGFCKRENCGSTIFSEDILISLTDNKIENFSLEEEKLLIYNPHLAYTILYEYLSDVMFIKVASYETANRKSIKFPIIQFDFSNKNNLVQRIKTLLVFN